MKTATLIFPHQIYRDLSLIDKTSIVFLIEESLFFKEYNFHKQKIAFHRATMKFYEKHLKSNGFKTIYIESKTKLCELDSLFDSFVKEGFHVVNIFNVSDDWLEKKIKKQSKKIKLAWKESQLFINSEDEILGFFKKEKKTFFQTSFYIQQRKKRKVLIDANGPVGGEWSFDKMNRKKYPKNLRPPKVKLAEKTAYHVEAKNYVSKCFNENFGEIHVDYPVTFEGADIWLEEFFRCRFFDFGLYEDAIVEKESFLNHSIISPLLNVGLLSPMDVVKKSISFGTSNNVPINSIEGFVRQIIGWREFIRGVYVARGSKERVTNFWRHKRPLPNTFYTGETGIPPIDQTIKKIIKTGYSHHIERLMVMSNFFLLCEINPDHVYQWFMEVYVDSYDWVMVPNVYGMGLYADGGVFSTKPYISGSNYLKKMSDYSSGKWEDVWNGLFWRFLHKNKTVLSKNPRVSLILGNLSRMNNETLQKHLETADNFLKTLK